MTEKLTPCYCGNHPILIGTKNKFVYCFVCGNNSKVCNTSEAAIKEWNRRAK